MSHGPHFSRLIGRRFSQLAVPAEGQLDAALQRLANEAVRIALVREAERWVEDLIVAARATFPEYYGMDDETIAAAILVSMRCEDSPFLHLPLPLPPLPEDGSDEYHTDARR